MDKDGAELREKFDLINDRLQICLVLNFFS